MDSEQQIILRMELQIGQLIRLVANLNERVDILEHREKNQKGDKVIQMKRISPV